ncbi:MAG: shikimate dehydrogenase [Elusimicrobia bacterium]|nr:shikimate dehydrogenase [Elusimicrobiota bacterium]
MSPPHSPQKSGNSGTTTSVFSDVAPGARRFGVVGWPLDYSLSPAMHNAAISFLGFNAAYRALRVSPDEWEGFAKNVDLDGFNVTIPYKEKVLALAQSLAGNVAVCRAANTLVRRSDGWEAHNTDGPGLLEDLRDHAMAWEGKSVVLLGAGGAARAALFALGPGARFITLVNRSLDRALGLAKEYEEAGGKGEVRVFQDIETSLRGADLLINATAVGLKAGDPSPVPERCLRQGLSLYDMIYHRETALVAAARATGARAVGGLGMLVNQGALGFELWFKDDLKKVKCDPRLLRKIMGDAARAALNKTS